MVWAMGNGQSAIGPATEWTRSQAMSSEHIGSYRDLSAWQRARELVASVYGVTRSFPADERFGLTSQLRRAAVSVPSNIAEGYGRGSTADYARFLSTARGSLFEVETQVTLACDLGMLSPDVADGLHSQIVEAARPLSGLIRSIEAK